MQPSEKHDDPRKRRVIDAEEGNIDVLTRAYLLTKDRRYADEALKRVKEIITWGGNKNIVGNFNEATMLSLCSTIYDTLHDLLDDATRQLLLEHIKKYGNNLFKMYNNRLENFIADNHVWQMNFRIFTMAAFTVYGELPEADTCGLLLQSLAGTLPRSKQRRRWHNGDSYFIVNVRTWSKFPIFIVASPATTTSTILGTRVMPYTSFITSLLFPNPPETVAHT